MRIRRRHVLVLAIALLVLGLGAMALFVLNQDPDRYRAQVAGLISDAAGYPVTLEGPLSLAWRPSPALTAREVQVAAPGARVTLSTVTIRVEPASLLARRFRARQVRVDGLRVVLAPGTTAGEAPPAIPDPAGLPVDELDLRDVTVMRGDATLLAITRARVREPDSAQGARVDLEASLGKAHLQGKTRLRVAPSRVELDQLAVHTPAGLVEGRLSLALDGVRPRLSGELTADALAFEDGGERAPGAMLIPRVPVDLAALGAVDGSVRLRVGRLSLAAIRVSDVTLPVTLRDGRLEARGSGTYAGGLASATLTVSAADKAWSMDVDLKEANAGGALVMLGVTGAESGGRLDANATLSASGDGTQAILESLSGRVSLDAADVAVHAGAARLAASDVIAGVLRAMRGEDSDRVAVECAVARFQVHGGVLVADQAIGVQSHSMNVLGGGRISLPDERLDLALRPWPREGLGLSATAVVGAVAVSGPLSDPQVGLTGEAAWRGGATAGAALLTGGLSLIAQGLMERARGDAPCQQAAGRPASASAPQRSPAGSGEVKREVGEAVRGIGDSIKGLFGGGGVGDATPGGRADR